MATSIFDGPNATDRDFDDVDELHDDGPCLCSSDAHPNGACFEDAVDGQPRLCQCRVCGATFSCVYDSALCDRCLGLPLPKPRGGLEP